MNNNPHYYVLIDDNCEYCQFTANAFTLLKLPLDRISLADFLEHPHTVSRSTAIFVCRHIEAEHASTLAKRLQYADYSALISFNQRSPLADLSNFCTLAMPFSIYQLKDLLSQCYHPEADHRVALDMEDSAFYELVGQSPQMQKVKAMIKQVAACDSNVLILGQSGTGKEVIASCIHYLSARKDKPLVPINCGAIPSELMESELFGHEKGAFTGALSKRAGRFEMANHGTLFLDEIGDMPFPMQVKLLRVLQDHKVERIGGTNSIEVNVRLIAATNQNLEDLITQHQFREDLYYRLNVFPIHVPSLSERPDDIPLLIDYLLDKIYQRLNHRVVFTERAMEILRQYAWPGNIRELANFLERMVILHQDHVLDEKDLDPLYKAEKKTAAAPAIEELNESSFNIKDQIAKLEEQLITLALQRSNGIISAAADYLSLGKSALIGKMKKYNL